MKKHKVFRSLFLIIFFSLLFTFGELSAQRISHSEKPGSSSTRYYEPYSNNSTSTSSEASHNRYERYNKRDDYYTDRYDRNRNYRQNDFNERRNNYNRKERSDYRNDYESNRKSYTENYFHIDRSGRTLWDGKHWELNDFPLKIYVKESSSRFYKSKYKDYVRYALNDWRKADDRISFEFVDSDREADISVYFVENLGKRYKENYLGLTEYDMGKRKDIDYSKIQISLIKFGDEIVSDGVIKATIVHEFGHAFGLGHSDNQKDIMYPYISEDNTPDMSYDELSYGDKEAIKDVIDLGKNKVYARR